MKGYKGFGKGMVCRGKQYAENTVYEEQGAKECCREGLMHFCETPMDVLNYYPILNDDCEFNEFAEVEALDEVLIDGDKRATKKLRIGAKLSIRDFIKAAVSVVIESTKPGKAKVSDLSDNGGYGAKIGSSGDGAKIGSSGDWAKIGSSGDWAKIGSSGYWAKIGSSGDWAKIGSSGDGAKINIRGTDSVGAAIGYGSMAKGAAGNWIVLAEWKMKTDNKWFPVCVKAGKIDGEALKPDTWYKLENGEFVEVLEE